MPPEFVCAAKDVIVLREYRFIITNNLKKIMLPGKQEIKLRVLFYPPAGSSCNGYQEQQPGVTRMHNALVSTRAHPIAELYPYALKSISETGIPSLQAKTIR